MVEFFNPKESGQPTKERERARTFCISNPDTAELPNWPLLGCSRANEDEEGWVRFAEESLLECVGSEHHAGHVECHQPSKPVAVPTRLIEMNRTSESLRLIETGNHPEIKRYATLSHSWGPEPTEDEPPRFTTTSENIHSLKDEIPNIGQMPATFQNAVTVCRRMNIDYLWIDSLCIIQGQDQAARADWAEESVKMYDYYGNSYITISGTCSPGSTIPFLKSKYLGAYPFEPVVFDFPGGGKVQVRRLGAEESSWIVPGAQDESLSSIDQVFENNPLFSRGWVFQENCLSTRVIHFSNTDVLFECKHSLKAESEVLPRGTTDLFSRIKTWTSTTEDTYTRWRRCVVSYFPLHLTQPGDRLPGLSGLAEGKSKHILSTLKVQPQYLAGLWSPDLARDLCWRLAGADGIISEEYIAPSWSWASVQASGLSYMANSKTFESLITLVDTNIILQNDRNTFGQVKKGSSITLTGYLKDMDLSHSVEGHYTISSDEPEILETWFWVLVDSRVEAQWTTCLLVGKGDGQLHGLILSPNPEDGRNSFTRIGYFRTKANLKQLDFVNGKAIWSENEEAKKIVDSCRLAFKAREETVVLF